MITPAQYFGFEQDPRTPEGFLSPQHLLYVTLMIALAVFLAVFLGRKNRNREEKSKLRVLKTAAVLMVSFELLKIVLISVRNGDIWSIRGMLPLFLCSIHLITLPLASFSRGRLQKISQLFLFIYGGICCIGGTYLAANYFANSPVISFDPMVSVTTHCIAGFGSVYVAVSGLVQWNAKRACLSLSLLVGFMLLAALANAWNSPTGYESNYMFLSHSAGTPFEICNTIVGGNQLLYSLFVAFLYIAWGLAFIAVCTLILNKKKKRPLSSGSGEKEA